MAKHIPKTFKRLLALIISIMMIVPAVPVMTVSADNGDYLIGPIDIEIGSAVSYGDNSWTNYIVEADIEGLTNLGTADWPCIKLNLRDNGNGTFYFLYISGDQINLQYALNWGGWTVVNGTPGIGVSNGNPNPYNQTVHYKVIAEVQNIKVYADDVLALDYTEPSGNFSAGGVRWDPDGVTCTIKNFTVKAIDKTPDEPEPDPLCDDCGKDPCECGSSDGEYAVNETPGTVTGSAEQWYGEYTWTDYTIETSVSNLVQTVQDKNYKVFFRGGQSGSMYQFIVTPGGWVGLQSSNGWSNLADGGDYGKVPGGSTPVDYKIEVAGNNIKVFINGVQHIDYNENPTVTNLQSGRVGWAVDAGLTADIHSFKVAPLDSGGTEPDPDPEPGDGSFTLKGPFDLPYAIGDSTWKDYEVEFDLTYKVSGGIRVGLRGGAYYSLIEGTGSRNPGLQPQSGQGGVWGATAVFPLDEAIRLKYRVEGTAITFWANDALMWTANTSTGFGTVVSSGGVIIASDNWPTPGDAAISNIAVRDLSGTIVPPEPPEPPVNEPIVCIDAPKQIDSGEFEWYGESTWKDYIIEATVSNIANAPTAGEWGGNFRLRFRSATAHYYLQITPGGWCGMQDSITWNNIPGTDFSGPSAGGNTPVTYRIEVVGNNVKIFVNGGESPVVNYTDTRNMLLSGQVGWQAEHATATIHSFKVTRLDELGGGDDTDPDLEVTQGSVNIHSPKVPVAGVYPISAFNYRPNTANWQYNETIVWSPAIQSTFLPNTAYAATVTLDRRSGSFGNNITLNDIGGIYLNALPYATLTSRTTSQIIITFNFPATGNAIAEWEEFKNTLFYDDFRGNSLDYKKWQNPVFYEQNRGGNSRWEAKNVSVNDGLLRLRFAKENASSNWVSTGAVRTRDLFDNAYGYYEASIKYPAVDFTRSGAWGAFWLMYYTSDITGKTGTEIDIVEFAGVHDKWASGGLHWYNYDPGHPSSSSMYYDSKVGPNIYDGEFHTYAMEWTPTEYIIYVDGIVAGRNTKQDMQKVNGDICENPLYIKLSIESSATGPDWNMNWGGPLDPGTWEDYMEVDYVVVYDRPKNAAAVYATDYVTLELDTVFENGQAKIAAMVKNADVFKQGSYSGVVSLDESSYGIIKSAKSKNYENLAYGQTQTLYFDIDMDAYYALDSTNAAVKFNYIVNELDGAGSSAQTKFGYVEAAKAVEDNIWANSTAIDFSKGIINANGTSASTLNASDLSATGNLAWDEDYLYVKIDVEDDVHSQTRTAGNRWEDDGVQISVGNGVGWREMEFTLANDLSNIYQYCYSNNTGASGGTGAVNQGASLSSEITRDVTTTTYEIKIAWAYVGITDVTKDSLNKISICINDNDGSGRKYIAYFDGIATGDKGQGMGYLVLTAASEEEPADPGEPQTHPEYFELGGFTIINSDNQKGWCTNGVDGVSTNLSMSTVKSAEKLVVEFNGAPSGDFQFIWQGDGGGSNWPWTQTNGIKANGATLTIDLASMTGWAEAVTGNMIKFYIGYWPSLDALEIVNAYFVYEVEGPGEPEEPTDPGEQPDVKWIKHDLASCFNNDADWNTWRTNGMDSITTNLEMSTLKLADKLVVEFAERPTGEMIFVLQSETNGWWTQTDISMPATGNILTIDIASTDGWADFIKAGQGKFNVIQWGNNNLQITNAYLLIPELAIIDNLPDKTTYAFGEDINLTGMSIWLYNAATKDYTKVSVTNTNSAVAGYNPNSFGGQTVTVTYKRSGVDYKVSFDVTVEQPENDLTVTIPTVQGVAKPRYGATPVNTITETAQFTGTLTWDFDDEVFAEYTVYTATITLTAKPAFTFDGVPANFFTVMGAVSVTNDADSGVITAVFPETGAKPDNTEMRGITASEAVAEMGIGWNLGNTFDAVSGGWFTWGDPEPAWVNIMTTKAMIDKVADGGFNVLRVPITWETGENEFRRVGNGPDYTIRPEFLDRIKEVVDWGLDNGMYVIINSHHDNHEDKIGMTGDDLIAERDKLVALWSQIAEYFTDYGDKLIFETMNEPHHGNDWNGRPEYYDNVNMFNQHILNAIRTTGGNNEKRFVLLPTYGASSGTGAMRAFVLPDDMYPDNLIASVHAYTPYNFALAIQTDQWSTSSWGTAADKQELKTLFANVDEALLSKGIPVIMGEFGAMNKNNDATRTEWAKYYISGAKQYGIPCVWWDNYSFTSAESENFGLLDRANLTFQYPLVLQGLMDGLAFKVPMDLSVNPVYNKAAGKWQIAARLKNIERGSVYSGTVDLISPAGYTAEASMPYVNLAYGEEITLYFDIDPSYVSVSAQEIIRFNYTSSDGENTYVGEDPAMTKFGVVSAAAYTDTPIIIDGNLDKDVWNNIAAELDAGKWVTDDKGTQAGTLNSDDLSVTGRLAWDDEYLYIALEVTDDVHAPQAAEKIGDLWQGDSIQVAVGSGIGITEMGFALTNDGAINKYCWGGGVGTIADNTIAAIIRDDNSNITAYEIAVKWSYLGIENPVADDIYKFTVCINDNDISPTNPANRKVIEYGEGIAVGTKGVNMGYLVLTKSPVICGECGELEENCACMENVSNAKFVSIAETSKNSRVWVLTFDVTVTYKNGSSKVIRYSINLDGNNANLDGKYKFYDGHELAGYTLVYDIKGNGSNIKDFRLIK